MESFTGESYSHSEVFSREPYTRTNAPTFKGKHAESLLTVP